MIRIHKPKTAPKKLTTDGKQKCKSHCDAYSLNPSAYETNKEKFDALAEKNPLLKKLQEKFGLDPDF